MADIKTHVTMAEWVWPLKEVEAWAKKPTSDLAIGFVSLKRWLTQEVADPAIRARAIPATLTFLDALDNRIRKARLPAEEMKLIFGILNTLVVEAGPYRYETKDDAKTEAEILAPMRAIRERVVEVYASFFRRAEFNEIRESIDEEVLPLTRSVLEEGRFMPFRLIQVAKLAERMAELAMWLDEAGGPEKLVALLLSFSDMKYPRFGTSGLRGRWQEDFTEIIARRTALAVCQYLNLYDVPEFVTPYEDLSGKILVIGYDGRRNSTTVADWLAEVALANGFSVHMTSRPTPTPVIAYYETEYLGKDNVAGVLNCTASHNPPEWQGIKFNPKEGYPAPTHLTNLIAERVNEMQMMDTPVTGSDIGAAEKAGLFKRFDPLVDYWEWIKNNGNGNRRIPLDFDAIKAYFAGKLVIIDEMHGSGRGYMQHMFGQLGLTFNVLHATRDIDLGGQAYANPERPFINPLIDAVKEKKAILGIGLDTDADRFGVVDEGGEYFRPNQVLAMLARYLAEKRKLEGRLVVTQTGLPLIEALADKYEGLERPSGDVVPPYVGHRFYTRQTGERETMVWKNVFVVPVGIKYIVEIPRMDTSSKAIPDDQLPTNWMDKLLLGGEESSGLTTRGQVPDKDGLWANLLIMDMIAAYQKPLKEIWKDLISLPGAWESFGGRVDIDASDIAKESLISHYIDLFKDVKAGEMTLEGYPVLYAGGTRFDLVEVFLGNKEGKMRNFLRLRASGTEPINRIYTETEDPELWKKLLTMALSKLDDFSVIEIEKAYRVQRLVDILTSTQPTDWGKMLAAVEKKLATEGWTKDLLITTLKIKHAHVEKRIQHLIEAWLERLS